MNSKGITLLAIAFIAIGIFALPGTVSMFGGQHNWYDVSPPGGNDVPCEKCHGDVADELGNSGPHVSMECWYCHRTGNLTGYTYASGDGTASIPGEEAHAASTVECMECHEGFGISYESCMQTNCHGYGPTTLPHPVEWLNEPCGNCHAEYTGEAHFSSTLEAGGFNLTINPSDTGTAAAHKAFVNDSINNSDLMEGANEACITCHTHVAIDINWTKEYNMALTVTADHEGNWTVGDFKSEGTYNVTTYGNMSGGTAWGNVTNITWANGTIVSNP
jgi:hypothetical protein